MKSALHIFALFFAIALFAAHMPAVFATNVESYVPMAPITYTIPGDTGNLCERLQNELTKIQDKRSPAYQTKTGEYKGACKTSLPEYLRGVYIAGIYLAGIFAVLSIVRGGFTLMWTDSFLARNEAKGIILRALGGLMIVYSSYLFVNAINPQLGKDLNLSLDFPRVKLQDPSAFANFLDVGGSRVSTQFNQQLLEKQVETLDKSLADRQKVKLGAIAGQLAAAAQKRQQAQQETDPAKAAALMKEADRITTDAYVEYAKTIAFDQRERARTETLLQSDKKPDEAKIADTLHRLDVIRQEYSNAALQLNAEGRGTEAAELLTQRITDITAVNQRLAENYLNAYEGASGYTGNLRQGISNQVAAIARERDQALATLNVLKNKYAAGSADRQKVEDQMLAVQSKTKASLCHIKTQCQEKRRSCPDLPRFDCRKRPLRTNYVQENRHHHTRGCAPPVHRSRALLLFPVLAPRAGTSSSRRVPRSWRDPLP